MIYLVSVVKKRRIMEEDNSNEIYIFDKLYLGVAVLLVLTIIYNYNILDVIYLIVFTVCFCRIKIHRMKKRQ